MGESGEPTEAEIDAVIEEFGGDMRAAIRGLLHDLAVFAVAQSQTVSRGYVRGRSVGMAVGDPSERAEAGSAKKGK